MASACSGGFDRSSPLPADHQPPPEPSSTSTTAPRSSGAIVPGKSGSFEFSGYESVEDHPLRVWYDAPANLTTAKVLVVMHGQQRNGEEYRDTWIPYAREHDALLIVPEFPESRYPGSESYNLGNVVDDNGHVRPEADWSYSVIEPLFNYVRADTGNRSDGYSLYGHSAGAQFVHRFMLLKPDNHVKLAVSANAGWYTAPEADVDFPYGLRGSPVTDAGLRRSLGAPLVVLLGEDDTETESDSLRQTPEAERQGENRLARGQFFFRTAQAKAGELHTPFGWTLQTVPDAAHSDEQMAPAAAEILFR